MTEAAVSAVRTPSPASKPGAPDAIARRSAWLAAATAAEERTIDWQRDDTATILRKLHAADGFPGVEDILLGRRFRLFDAHREERLPVAPAP